MRRREFITLLGGAAAAWPLAARAQQPKKLATIGCLGTIRSPLLPNVPTMSEAGYPEVNVVPWYGYGAPRSTPQPVIDKIVAGFNEVMKVPSVRAALQKQALQPMEPMSAGQIAELYAADTEKYAKVIREAGIKLSD